MARVGLRPSFIKDYERQLRYLATHADATWLERLWSAISAARERVEEFPEAYPVERQTTEFVVRRIGLGAIPYVILYMHLPGRPIRRIWFVHLFHHRQDRPVPEIPDWP